MRLGRARSSRRTAPRRPPPPVDPNRTGRKHQFDPRGWSCPLRWYQWHFHHSELSLDLGCNISVDSTFSTENTEQKTENRISHCNNAENTEQTEYRKREYRNRSTETHYNIYHSVKIQSTQRLKTLDKFAILVPNCPRGDWSNFFSSKMVKIGCEKWSKLYVKIGCQNWLSKMVKIGCQKLPKLVVTNVLNWLPNCSKLFVKNGQKWLKLKRTHKLDQSSVDEWPIDIYVYVPNDGLVQLEGQRLHQARLPDPWAPLQKDRFAKRARQHLLLAINLS